MIEARRAVRLACILSCLGCGAASKPAPVHSPPSGEPQARPVLAEKPNLLRVQQPAVGAVVASPLIVRGEARGGWYFEASFPLRVLDAAGNTVAQGYAQAQGEWMTESFVPFEGTLSFEAPASADGVLVLEKANASGLPEHADELRVPLRFR
jgi:hypothetical protein